MGGQIKRELCEVKREVKRAGNKHRRRVLKQFIVEHPEDAAIDTTDVGDHRSADLNGIESDSTRKKKPSE